MNDSIIPLEIWIERAEKHRKLVKPVADAFIKRRELGQTHAVHDFLFTYYSCSPLKLIQWVPSFEEKLILPLGVPEAYSWLNSDWFMQKDGFLFLNQEKFSENKKDLAKFICNLCAKILERPSRFGCFGLHEWAMVYKSPQEDIRHEHPFRLSHEEIAKFVESQTLCCTHYDAYRFFTKAAYPLNTLKPCLESRLEFEQGGCVHANMDLYKWATKLWPWIGSDFIAKTFFLALEGRELDMRASPYDLKNYGYTPLCIETESGRKEYQKLQQAYAEKTLSFRLELLSLSKRLSLMK